MDIRKGSKIVKTVCRLINNVGCSTIVSNIITTTMVPGNIITTICVKGAGIFLGSALGDFANDYTDRKIDEVTTAYEEGHLVETILGLDIPEEENVVEVDALGNDPFELAD